MKRILWLASLMLAVTACVEEPIGVTTVEAAGTDLSGLALEVHQAPG